MSNKIHITGRMPDIDLIQQAEEAASLMSQAGADLVPKLIDALKLSQATIEVLEHQRNTLRGWIIETLDENSHLADGDMCTLINLKLALRKIGTPWDGDNVEDLE